MYLLEKIAYKLGKAARQNKKLCVALDDPKLKLLVTNNPEMEVSLDHAWVAGWLGKALS